MIHFLLVLFVALHLIPLITAAPLVSNDVQNESHLKRDDGEGMVINSTSVVTVPASTSYTSLIVYTPSSSSAVALETPSDVPVPEATTTFSLGGSFGASPSAAVSSGSGSGAGAMGMGMVGDDGTGSTSASAAVPTGFGVASGGWRRAKEGDLSVLGGVVVASLVLGWVA